MDCEPHMTERENENARRVSEIVDEAMANPPDPSRPGYLGAERRQAIADTRAVRAVHLKIVESKTYGQIAEELGISAQAAQAAYKRGVKMLVPEDEVIDSKRIALQKLDVWEQMALEIYNAEHIMVNFGKVVYGVFDYGPKLQAIDRLIKIERERRAIIGYSAPSKRVLEVVTADVFDKAIEQLNKEAADLERVTQAKDLAAGMAELKAEVLSPPAE